MSILCGRRTRPSHHAHHHSLVGPSCGVPAQATPATGVGRRRPQGASAVVAGEWARRGREAVTSACVAVAGRRRAKGGRRTAGRAPPLPPGSPTHRQWHRRGGEGRGAVGRGGVGWGRAGREGGETCCKGRRLVGLCGAGAGHGGNGCGWPRRAGAQPRAVDHAAYRLQTPAGVGRRLDGKGHVPHLGRVASGRRSRTVGAGPPPARVGGDHQPRQRRIPPPSLRVGRCGHGGPAASYFTPAPAVPVAGPASARAAGHGRRPALRRAAPLGQRTWDSPRRSGGRTGSVPARAGGGGEFGLGCPAREHRGGAGPPSASCPFEQRVGRGTKKKGGGRGRTGTEKGVAQ